MDILEGNNRIVAKESFLICDESDGGILVRNGKLMAFCSPGIAAVYIAKMLIGLYSIVSFDPNHIELTLGEIATFEYIDSDLIRDKEV